jgi:ATP-binding cassette, subfamily B (MDR/TAP), member 1
LSIFRFATNEEIVMIIVCGFCSVLIGVVLPAFAYLTGNMIDSFHDASTVEGTTKNNLYSYIGLGVGAFVVGTAMFFGWMLLGERQALRCRKIFFESLIRQEIAWFDTQSQA